MGKLIQQEKDDGKKKSEKKTVHAKVKKEVGLKKRKREIKDSVLKRAAKASGSLQIEKGTTDAMYDTLYSLTKNYATAACISINNANRKTIKLEDAQFAIKEVSGRRVV